jgi:hypothetical protein
MDGFLKQSTAAQIRTIGVFVDDTDFKSLENALTIANTDILIKKNGGASAAKNSGGATADGSGGLYAVTWDATDTGTVGELKYSVKVAGALVVFGSYFVLEEAVYDALFAAAAAGYGTAQTGDNFARLGAPAGASLAADVAAVKVDTAAILVDTGTTLDARIPAALVGGRMDANVGALSADSVAADNAEAFFDGTGYAGTGNVIPSVTTVTGNVNGSVGSVTGAVGSVTGAVGSVTGAVGSVTGAVGSVGAGGIAAASFAAGAIDAAAIAADAIGASELAAGAVDEILDDTIGDGTITVRQALRILIAGMAGKLSGAATTTVTIRNLADSADVVVATVDANGNRSAVTVTP